MESGFSKEAIAARAYELYLKDGEEYSATEYWLKAEEQLRQEHDKRRVAGPTKSITVTAGINGHAKTGKSR